MALSADQLSVSMIAAIPAALQAAQITGATLLEDISKVLPGEVKKMAVQLAAIEQAGFSPAIAKQLIQMQRESFEDVLIALFEVTVLRIQQLINALLQVIAGVVNGALGFVLL